MQKNTHLIRTNIDIDKNLKNVRTNPVGMIFVLFGLAEAHVLCGEALPGTSLQMSRPREEFSVVRKLNIQQWGP